MTKAAKANKAAKGGNAKAPGGKPASAMTKLVSGLIQKVKAVGAPKPAAKPKAAPAKPARPVAAGKSTGKAVSRPASRSTPKSAPPAKSSVKAAGKTATKATAKPAVKPGSKSATPKTATPKAPAPKAPTPKAATSVAAASKVTSKPALQPVAQAKARAAEVPSAAGAKPATPVTAPAGGSKKATPAATTATPAAAAVGRSVAVAVAVAVATPKTKTPQKMPLKKPSTPIKVVGTELVRPTLPDGYKPAADEPYMSPNHIEYFRQKLAKWRGELVEESKQTIDNLRDEVRDVGDEAERATRETENSLELRTRDRYRKLISKIDKALKRIEDGEYGFCEETGEEIGLERLEARPIATMCLDAQERWEHRQRQLGD